MWKLKLFLAALCVWIQISEATEISGATVNLNKCHGVNCKNASAEKRNLEFCSQKTFQVLYCNKFWSKLSDYINCYTFWTILSASTKCGKKWRRKKLAGSISCVLKVIRMRLFARRRDWAGWDFHLFHHIDFLQTNYYIEVNESLTIVLFSTVITNDVVVIHNQEQNHTIPPILSMITIWILSPSLSLLPFISSMSPGSPFDFELRFRHRCWPSLMWPMCVQQFATVTRHMWQ